MKKIVKISRLIDEKNNVLHKDFFDFKEGSKNFIILKPLDYTNKPLSKNDFMSPKCDFEFEGTHIYGFIYCYDYQIKEAEDILNEKINYSLKKERERINKQLDNLKTVEAFSKKQKLKLSETVHSSEKFIL